MLQNSPTKIENKIKFYKGKILFSIDSIKCICAIVPASSINKLLEYPNIDYIFFLILTLFYVEKVYLAQIKFL